MLCVYRKPDQPEDAVHHPGRSERAALLERQDPERLLPGAKCAGQGAQVREHRQQVDRGRDSGVVARGGGRVVGLRRAQRDQARLLLPDKHLAAVDRLLRSQEDRVLCLAHAQVPGEDADHEQSGRHSLNAGTLRRTMGLSERVAAAPVHHGHVAGQFG